MVQYQFHLAPNIIHNNTREHKVMFNLLFVFIVHSSFRQNQTITDTQIKDYVVCHDTIRGGIIIIIIRPLYDYIQNIKTEFKF